MGSGTRGERDRQTETERDRNRQTETDRDKDTDTETDKQTDRLSEKKRERSSSARTFHSGRPFQRSLTTGTTQLFTKCMAMLWSTSLAPPGLLEMQACTEEASWCW